MNENRKPGSARPKMTISQRAKQFAPFAALTGLEVAIARKEWEHASQDRIEISEESCEELNRKLSELYPGDTAKISYFSRGHYHTLSGTINRIDSHNKLLIIDNIEIHFKDIRSIK